MYERLINAENLSKDLKNAVLESFLIHVRNLIDFFQGTAGRERGYKKNRKDIIIKDFIDGNGKELDIVENWKISREDKQKINKLLAHLSEDRLELERGWEEEIKNFGSEIENQIEEFLEKISEEYFPLTITIEITKENFGKCRDKVSEITKGIDVNSTNSFTIYESETKEK
jgi:hypothetical protein